MCVCVRVCVYTYVHARICVCARVRKSRSCLITLEPVSCRMAAFDLSATDKDTTDAGEAIHVHHSRRSPIWVLEPDTCPLFSIFIFLPGQNMISAHRCASFSLCISKISVVCNVSVEQLSTDCVQAQSLETNISACVISLKSSKNAFQPQLLSATDFMT